MRDQDIVFFEAESQRPDDTFGGQLTSRVIVSGQVGNLVPPIASVDKVSGYVAGYKFYVAANTADMAVYYKPWVFIAKPPADAEVGVVLLSTGSAYDRWAEARAKLEQYLVVSGRWYGRLYGLQLAGQKSVQIYQATGGELPSVGEVYALTKSYGTDSAHIQLVRTTDVAVATRLEWVNNHQIPFDFITLKLAERLDQDYDGGALSLYDVPGAAEFRTTRVADAVTLYGIKALQQEAAAVSNTVQVDSIYHRLIPAAESSTNLPNMDIGGKARGLIASGVGSYGFTTTAPLGPNLPLYLGMSAQPGSVAIGSLTDDGRGSLLSGSTVVAAISYTDGIVTGLPSAPTYSGSKAVSFIPAAAPVSYVHSTSIGVDSATRRENYVITLAWVPAPGSLQVAYLAGGKVYKIWDRGAGILQGVDTSHGVGQFRWDTNTLEFTLLYLADTDTEIVISSGVSYSVENQAARFGTSLPAAQVQLQLTHAGGVPGSFVITWNDGTPRNASDDGRGEVTGSAPGYVRYSAPGGPLVVLWCNPLPPVDTVFAISYDTGDPYSYTVTNPSLDGDGFTTIELPYTGLHSGSVEVAYTAGGFAYAVRDDGEGGFLNRDHGVEWVNYVDGTLRIKTKRSYDRRTSSHTTATSGVLTSSQQAKLGMGSGNGTTNSTTVTTSFTETTTLVVEELDSPITIRYRLNATGAQTTELITADKLYLELTPGLNQPILPNTALFTLAGRIYRDNNGRLLTDLDHSTGAGLDAGTLDNSSGLATLTVWSAGTPAPNLYALLTVLGRVQAADFVFLSPTRPLAPGSVQLLATTEDGVSVNATVPSSGILADTHVSGIVNVDTGIFHLRFGDWHTLETGDDALWWYDAGNIRVSDGKIWKPILIFADTLRVNATAISYLPVDKAEIGINPSAFPGNGLVQGFAKGDNVVVHHEGALSLAPPLGPIEPGGVYVTRPRLYRCRVTDANGLDIPSSATTWVDYSTPENGLWGVQFAYNPTLDLSPYVQPFTLYHQILDRMRILDVDLSGLITFERPLSHTYPQGAFISKALSLGNLLVSLPVAFTQATWTNVWSDTRIGNEPIMQYQSALYPIELVNDGAVTDRWVLVMQSASTYHCYSEGLGKVNATAVSINADFSPQNPLTGKAYFTARAGFLGQGGNIGECFRFDTVGANRGIWPIVTILPGTSTATYDQFQVQVIGDAAA